MQLAGKLAVITGAASGMGRAGVQRFVKEGARVAAIDLDPQGLDALVNELGHDNVVPMVADLTDPEAARASIEGSAAALGGIDICWTNAGMPGQAGFDNLDLEAFQRTIDLNVRAAAIAIHQAVPHLRRRGGGSIVLTASMVGLVGSVANPIYSTSKHAVIGLARSLALTFATQNIRVNALCPGLTDTPMKTQFMSPGGEHDEDQTNTARFLAATPMGRLGLAEEMASAALWLASDDSSYVTGIALPVDGGFSCR